MRPASKLKAAHANYGNPKVGATNSYCLLIQFQLLQCELTGDDNRRESREMINPQNEDKARSLLWSRDMALFRAEVLFSEPTNAVEITI